MHARRSPGLVAPRKRYSCRAAALAPRGALRFPCLIYRGGKRTVSCIREARESFTVLNASVAVAVSAYAASQQSCRFGSSIGHPAHPDASSFLTAALSGETLVRVLTSRCDRRRRVSRLSLRASGLVDSSWSRSWCSSCSQVPDGFSSTGLSTFLQSCTVRENLHARQRFIRQGRCRT